MRVIILILCYFLLIMPSHAGEIFPHSLWESRALDEGIVSVASADINQDTRADFIYALPRCVVVANFLADMTLTRLAMVKALAAENFHRVHAGDYNHDGTLEILVNGFVRKRPFSRIFTFQNGELVPVREFDAVVMPLFWKGEERLFSQTHRGRGEWSRFLVEITWDGNRYQNSSAGLQLTRGIGSNVISLFALIGLGDSLAYLHDDGRVIVIDENGKVRWRSGNKFGGAVDSVTWEGKDPLGVKSQQRLDLAPRMAYQPDGGFFYVPKNDGFLPAALGAFPNMKSAQYRTFFWAGGGFQERAASQNYDGAISDIQLVDFNGDGIKNEILLALWSRKGGVLESSHPAASLLVVLPGEREIPAARVEQPPVSSVQLN